MTIMELEIGILQIERRDQYQGNILRHSFEQQIIAIDTKIALTCARLHVSDPRSERDALIVVTAITHGMTIVTRNVADFQATGVAILNPWHK